MKNGIIIFISIILAMFVAGGCMGYRLGNTLPPGIKSIYVPTFKNLTNEPEIETRTTSVALQEFRRDGSLRIADSDAADARLEVTLVRYELFPLRYGRNDARAADEYRLQISARVVLRMAVTGEAISESLVRGDTTFILSGDLSSSKLLALTDAARDLAHDIVESIVEYWP